MAFDAPTLSDMRVAVLRSLRDPNGNVFLPETVNDFIDTAMSDLSIYRPAEQVVVATWPPTGPLTWDGLSAIFGVQYVVTLSADPNDVRVVGIPPASGSEARAGWDFFNKTLLISDVWQRQMNAIANEAWPIELRVFGYVDRDIPLLDTDILDLRDNTDYLCVLTHCKHLGFEVLNHDRSLYQQWLAATNNTDVSPTQLQGMTSVAEQSYERNRSRNTMLRRVPSGSAFSY